MKKWIVMGLACLFLALCLPKESAEAASAAGRAGREGIQNGVPVLAVSTSGRQFGTTSPWLSGKVDESIYENDVDAKERDQNIVEKAPGLVERHSAELLRNMGSSLISLLRNKMGVSIDRIVFGRVGSGSPNEVNVFAFELRAGNPYGVTASVCYALLRGIMYIFLGIWFVFQLAKGAWSGQTAKSREEIKSMLPTVLAKFVAMALMPYLLDVVLYVRDVILYGIKEMVADMISGGATLSLSEAFLYNAERSGTFVDAAMYLGTVVLTIYFVFLYVAVAIDMLVCFVSFPFICVLHGRKKNLIDGWVTAVFSDIMTPVIDAVLLVVPLLTSLMLQGVVSGLPVIQLVMCMLIIPARSRFKALLGIQGSDRNGFLGAMAVLRLGRAIAGMVRQGAERMADAVSDARNSRMHGELAEVDEEEERSLLSDDPDGKKYKEREGGAGAAVEGGGSGSDEQGDADESLTAVEDAPLPEGPDVDMREMSPTDRRDEVPSAKDSVELEEDAAFAAAPPSINGSRPDDVVGGIGASRGGDDQVEAVQDRLDELKEQRVDLATQEKRISRRMQEHERDSDGYRRLQREREKIRDRIAQVDDRITAENGRLNRLRAQSRRLRDSMGAGGAPSIYDEWRKEVLRKRASITNFEQPQFKGVLSNDQLRKLYRRRAIANGTKVVTGTIGAAAFGVTAGSTALFMGPSAAAIAASDGIGAGNGIGIADVDVAAEIVRTTGSVTRAIRGERRRAGAAAAPDHELEQAQPAASQHSSLVVDVPPEKGTDEFDPVVEGGGHGEGSSPSHEVERIAADAGKALRNALTQQGEIRSGAALRAMQQANVELEREIAILKEEGGKEITEEMIRERRIAIQTDAVTNAILRQMEKGTGYEKGSEAYAKAEDFIRQKVGSLLENREKSLL